MAEIKVISEYFVKPKYEVEGAKQPYDLAPIEIVMLSLHPIQKGLVYNNPCSSKDDRTKLVSRLVDKLKHSLSIALVHFYPLAGRLATTKYPDEHACSIFVDCVKGPGARLIHATSALELTTLSSTIVRSMFDLGDETVNYDGHTRALLTIQVTELQDGVFIGFSMNHSVVDGTSFIHFISMLSEIFRCENNNNDSENTTLKISRVPIFGYKPWLDSSSSSSSESNKVIKLPYLEAEEFITRRYEANPLRERIFHFSPDAMARLKAKANQECGTHNVISSFQALSSLVWRSITRARNLSLNQSTSFTMLINARTRLDPPLIDDFFGNLIKGVDIDCNVGELLSNELGWVAMKLHEGLMAHDAKLILGFYKSLAESLSVAQPRVEPDLHGTKRVIIGGSSRFDMYGAEFGLGRPLAVRMGFGNKEDGKVTANPDCQGRGGVDLEICLQPHFMDALESNSEFMDFVSLH